MLGDEVTPCLPNMVRLLSPAYTWTLQNTHSFLDTALPCLALSVQQVLAKIMESILSHTLLKLESVVQKDRNLLGFSNPKWLVSFGSQKGHQHFVHKINYQKYKHIYCCLHSLLSRICVFASI